MGIAPCTRTCHAPFGSDSDHAAVVGAIKRRRLVSAFSGSGNTTANHNISINSLNPTIRKDTELAKVNYQYEKRQKELEKKRKKEQKEKLKQSKKNIQPTETQETQDTPQAQPPEK